MIHNSILRNYQNEYHTRLLVEKALVENNFDWLSLEITNKLLHGKGRFLIGSKNYDIEINYSPFFKFRFDRIFIKSEKIVYNDDIHIYPDLSLCLYHPTIDRPFLKIIPLYKMIPRIVEWCINYENYKKYSVWISKEIKH